MSASGYTPILLYGSTTASNVPLAANLTTSASGIELAVNAADGKLFYKDSGGVVQVLASKAGNVNVSSFSAGTTGFTPNTATTGAVTLAGTLATTNGGTGLTSFTANGVVYASSTSALTTGSALTFNGTTLTATATTGASVTYPAYFDNSGGGVGTGSRIGFRNTGTSYGEIGYLYDGVFSFNIDSAGSGNTRFLLGGSEQMRLTSTGLGIGTSSPSAKLDVAGSAPTVKVNANNGTQASLQLTQQGVGNWLKYFRVSDSSLVEQFGGTDLLFLTTSGNLGLGVTPSAWYSASGFKALQLGLYGFTSLSDGGSAYTSRLNNNSYYNASGIATYTGANLASEYRQSAGVHSWYNAPSGTAGNAITFTQAMTLDASGNLLVGKTSASNYGDGVQIYPAGTIGLGHPNGTGSGAAYALFGYNGTGIGSITQSGTTAVLYNVTSDQHLKTNIVDAAPASTLIDAIQVRQFDWKSDGSHQRYGFIAQELVTVAPEAVHQPADPEEMMAVDYSKLVPMLVKEIQSLRQRLAAAGI